MNISTVLDGDGELEWLEEPEMGVVDEDDHDLVVAQQLETGDGFQTDKSQFKKKDSFIPVVYDSIQLPFIRAFST